MPTNKYVQLHPTNTEDNTIDEQVNLYPIIGPDSFKNFDPEEASEENVFKPQKKLISGTDIKTYSLGAEDHASLLQSGNIDFNAVILELVYPIGSIYTCYNDDYDGECPIAIKLGGTWERIKDKFLWAKGDNDTLGDTAGSKDAVVVSHTHTVNNNTNGLVTERTVNPDNTSQNKDLTGYAHFLNTNYSYPRTMTAAGGILSTYSWGEATSDTLTGSSDKHQPLSLDINANHKHTIPPHNHTLGNATNGVSGLGKNMPPYLVVMVWKRIA